MEAIVSAKALDVGYDRKAVISNVCLEGLKGQMICLLGPNGAGKSTILRTLSGLLAPVKGTVVIDGKDIRHVKKTDMARKLSLVLTDTVSPGLTTVRELVAMGRMPYTGFMGRMDKQDWIIVESALQTVDAIHLQNRFYTQLSDGEKQKVMIARALVQEPELIILDEPTSHLDIKHKIEVIRILQKLVNEKKITCILSLHDIDLALKGCQSVLLIDEGQVVAQGAPEEVIHNGSIQKLYDIQGATYNELLGSVELKGKAQNDIFVVGGNASGINVYRALARKDWGMTTGVLHENDADAQIAEAICFETVIEEPFEEISLQKYNEALELMRQAKCLVDTGFAIGRGNRKNQELVMQAILADKPIFSMRKQEDIKRLYQQNAEKICCCCEISELLSQIAKQVMN